MSEQPPCKDGGSCQPLVAKWLDPHNRSQGDEKGKMAVLSLNHDNTPGKKLNISYT